MPRVTVKWVIAALVLLLMLLSAIVFALERVIPEDPVARALGEDATPEEIARMRQRLGLDQPVYLQYIYWLRDLLTFHSEPS